MILHLTWLTADAMYNLNAWLGGIHFVVDGMDPASTDETKRSERLVELIDVAGT
jgi:hypothetical protein